MYKWVSVDAFRSGTDRAVTDWNRSNRTMSISHLWSLSPTMINEIMATARFQRDTATQRRSLLIHLYTLAKVRGPFGPGLFPGLQMQFTQLLVADGGRRTAHQVYCPCGLGEGNHVAQRPLARKDHHQAV